MSVPGHPQPAVRCSTRARRQTKGETGQVHEAQDASVVDTGSPPAKLLFQAADRQLDRESGPIDLDDLEFRESRVRADQEEGLLGPFEHDDAHLLGDITQPHVADHEDHVGQLAIQGEAFAGRRLGGQQARQQPLATIPRLAASCPGGPGFQGIPAHRILAQATDHVDPAGPQPVEKQRLGVVGIGDHPHRRLAQVPCHLQDGRDGCIPEAHERDGVSDDPLPSAFEPRDQPHDQANTATACPTG